MWAFALHDVAVIQQPSDVPDNARGDSRTAGTSMALMAMPRVRQTAGNRMISLPFRYLVGETASE
jgi:hypothetical protein